MKKLVFLTFILLLQIAFVTAQDSLLIEAIKANTYTLNVSGDKFTGTGAAVIEEAVKTPQFLLVGEQHGIQAVGQFTKALFLAGAPHGFEYFCFETDPFVAAKLEELVSQDLDALKAFSKELPLTIPFYNNVEDFDMFQKILQASDAESPVFWGIDQVFVAAPRFLFTKLVAIAPNEEAKQLASDYLEQGKQGADHFFKTGDQSKSLMSTLKPADFEKLYAAFGDTPDLESTEILKGIQKTQEIYGYYYQGKQYDNNRSRIYWMKQQFMEYYRNAAKDDKQPKVVFKFGATHTYRGLSFYDQFDIGNLASELAEMNGSHSLHFYVAGIKGKTAGFLGPDQEFDNTDNLNELLREAVQDRFEQEDWILVDMRPLRHQFNSRKIKPIRDIVYSYDFWVLVPNAKPLTTF